MHGPHHPPLFGLASNHSEQLVLSELESVNDGLRWQRLGLIRIQSNGSGHRIHCEDSQV